jgi:hypothetical protein
LQRRTRMPATSIDGGDIEITDSTRGVVLKAPNDTRYRVTVNNSGVLVVTTA